MLCVVVVCSIPRAKGIGLPKPHQRSYQVLMLPDFARLWHVKEDGGASWLVLMQDGVRWLGHASPHDRVSAAVVNAGRIRPEGTVWDAVACTVPDGVAQGSESQCRGFSARGEVRCFEARRWRRRSHLALWRTEKQLAQHCVGGHRKARVRSSMCTVESVVNVDAEQQMVGGTRIPTLLHQSRIV